MHMQSYAIIYNQTKSRLNNHLNDLRTKFFNQKYIEPLIRL